MKKLETYEVECSCGCEYVVIIRYLPPFVDAVPRCPACGKKAVR